MCVCEAIEFPIDIEVVERGTQSKEKDAQTEREQNVLGAVYVGALRIPDTAGEADVPPIRDEDLDKDLVHMTAGDDADRVFWAPQQPHAPMQVDAQPSGASVADLLANLGSMPQVAAGFAAQASSGGLGFDPAALLQSLDPARLAQLSNAASQQQQQQQQQPQPSQYQDSSSYYNGANNEYDGYQDSQYGRDRESGRGRGRGRGRGARGGSGAGFTRKQIPCTFYQQGRQVYRTLLLSGEQMADWGPCRCRYGDQCDFAHEMVS
jgi:protein phosphatase 1 regulatory subunit 10